MTARDPDEWDAEIEAEFQRVVRGTKAAGRLKRRQRWIGCPVAFLAEVCRRTKGRGALVVALCVYRRTCVQRHRTVTVPSADLADVGIDRRRLYEALAMLEKAGLLRREQPRAGQSTRVTLTWSPG
jgi:hypothetical protein